MAPDCAIRHPVWQMVALQRRMRFSARLAGFCRGRWHQRRARRAEQASFSVLVSNLDFRVPRLRPNRRTGADLAVRQRKRGHPRGPESRPRLSRRSRPSTFWSRCNPGLLDVHLSPGMDPGPRPKVWHPVSGRCFPARTGDPESPSHRLLERELYTVVTKTTRFGRRDQLTYKITCGVGRLLKATL